MKPKKGRAVAKSVKAWAIVNARGKLVGAQFQPVTLYDTKYNASQWERAGIPNERIVRVEIREITS